MTIIRLAELRTGSRAARTALFVNHAAHVERVLVGVLGPDPEIPDLLQEVFVAAFKSIGDYRGDDGGLRFWLAQIAVNLARLCIRRRTRLRFFLRRAQVEPPHYEPVVEDQNLAEALRRARSVLERMPVDERIPLSLAILQGRSLQETAALCRISLATLKRRLQKGRKRFLRLAALDPILRDFCPEVAP
jgi:RNA polymerase sigma-70 factor (ECF subfamily)